MLGNSNRKVRKSFNAGRPLLLPSEEKMATCCQPNRTHPRGERRGTGAHNKVSHAAMSAYKAQETINRKFFGREAISKHGRGMLSEKLSLLLVTPRLKMRRFRMM
jgi:hypothetical protein